MVVGRQHSSRNYVNEAVYMVLTEELQRLYLPTEPKCLHCYAKILVLSASEPGVDGTTERFAYRHNHCHLLTSVCHTEIIFYVCLRMEKTGKHCIFLARLEFQVSRYTNRLNSKDKAFAS